MRGSSPEPPFEAGCTGSARTDSPLVSSDTVTQAAGERRSGVTCGPPVPHFPRPMVICHPQEVVLGHIFCLLYDLNIANRPSGLSMLNLALSL